MFSTHSFDHRLQVVPSAIAECATIGCTRLEALEFNYHLWEVFATIGMEVMNIHVNEMKWPGCFYSTP